MFGIPSKATRSPSLNRAPPWFCEKTPTVPMPSASTRYSVLAPVKEASSTTPRIDPGAAAAVSASIRSFSGRMPTRILPAWSVARSLSRVRELPATSIQVLARVTGDRGRHEVGLAQEVRDKSGSRKFVQFLRRAHLLNLAVVHHGHGVRHGHGFFLVVGDVDEGQADFRLDLLQFHLHLAAQFHVQRTERLIQEQSRPAG